MTATCVIPGCRIRGRHQTTCDTEQCPGCLPRVADEGLACDWHVEKTRERLALIAQLTPDARLVAAGQVKRGQGGASGKPGSQSPMNDGATDALDAVANTLTTIARDIAETRGLVGARTWSSDPIVRAVRMLSEQLGWLRHACDEMGQPRAVHVFAEIGDCAARMRGLVDGRSAGRYAGPCGYVDEDDQLCGEDVVARPGADTAECKACGSRYDVDARQQWMRDGIRDQLARPVEIASILTQLGFPIGYSTVAAYIAKGHVVAHGHDVEGKPRYRIGDVLDRRIEAMQKPTRKRQPQH